MKRIASAVRTAIERRGARYAADLVRRHAVPAAAYHALRLLPPSTRDTVLRMYPGRPMVAGVIAKDLDGVPLREIPGDEISDALVDDIIDQVESLHQRAIAGVASSIPNMLVDRAGARARFSELSAARVYSSVEDLVFAHRRDLDRQAINERFGRSLLTEESARRALADIRGDLLDGWTADYAPIDFGLGVAVGQFLKTDSGTGRWECFNSSVIPPIVNGRRVVDLGCNNGSMTMMALRSGAAEVVGVERKNSLARAARLVCDVAAWRDVRPYRAEIKCDDMRAFCGADWGRFDVVMALCSLYYLAPEDMVRVAATARTMNATMVVQGNTAMNGTASPESLIGVLQAGGYRNMEVVPFNGFNRPLVVARPA